MCLRFFRIFAILLLVSSSLLLNALSVLAASKMSPIGLRVTGRDHPFAALPVTGSISSSTSSAIQAQDSLPFPPWWSGVCDTNTYTNSVDNPNHLPAYPLPKGASVPTNYRGVVACGPRPIADKGPDHQVFFFQGDKVGAYEWECVELSMRFMYLAYGIHPYNGNGDQVVDNYDEAANPILHKVSNDGSTHTVPQPGDVLSYTSSVPGGHTSVVSASNVDGSGNGTITVIEQNFSSSGTTALNVKNWIIQPNESTVKNWLHHTVDVAPQSGLATTSVTMRGERFAANETVNITLETSNSTILLGVTQASSNGTFSTSVTIPSSVLPGVHALRAIGQTSRFSPQTVFYVRSNWDMFGHDLAHTHYNALEDTVSVSQVPQLSQAWTVATGSFIQSSPAVVTNIVYVGSNDSNLYAIDASMGRTLWMGPIQSGADVFSSPTVANGVVYVGSGLDSIYAFNAAGCGGNASCLPLWIGITTAGYGVNSSPAVANGVVYVGANDGKLYAFNAAGCGSATCSPLWTANIGGGASSPVVVNGVVYIGGGDFKLYAFNAAGCGSATCSPLWTGAASSFLSSPAVANGVVYVDSYDGKMYAFKASGCGNTMCSPLWAAGAGSSIQSSPAVANGVVYTGSGDGKLYAFSAAGCGNPSCSPLWTASAGNFIQSSPSIANGVVYIGSFDHQVYAFNATGCGSTSCFPLWTAPTGDIILSSPAVTNGAVYIGSNDGKLYAFHVPGMMG